MQMAALVLQPHLVESGSSSEFCSSSRLSRNTVLLHRDLTCSLDGTCQQECYCVQVRGGGGSGLDDESTTTGIIIIAVVCCVVGTSLVWVIIIYQTRKRHEMYSATPTGSLSIF